MVFSIVTVWFALFSLASIFWLWGYVKNNPSVIDVGWSIGILVAGSIYILVNDDFSWSNYKILLYWLLLIVWSLRLSLFLYFTRIYQKQIDQRYLHVSEKWTINKSFGFFMHYQFQAILMLLVATPFYYIAKLHGVNFKVIDFIAATLIVVAIIGESVADIQLRFHKKRDPNSICTIGFWQYSRHPNYFFEWLIWIGFSMAAIGAPLGYIAFISPLLLLYLFIFVTGPITEACSVKSRGSQYIIYQHSTSMFMPWLKRKRHDRIN